MKILFLGDFYYDYNDLPSDYKRICSFVKEKKYSVIVNLESSLSNSGKPIKKRGPNLCSSGSAIRALKEINTLAVTLANNHTMDYDTQGLLKTIEMLDRAKIKHIGAGTNLIEAQKTIIFDNNTQKIILINCGWNVEETVYATNHSAGCAPLCRNSVINIISDLKNKNKNSKLILCVHWGFEYNTLPMPVDIQFAHRCIDAGCDLIIGHHPHVVQPKEIYKGKKIFYSLGNFYFASRRNTFNREFPQEQERYYARIGAGVILDINSWKTEEIKVEYSFINDESEITILNFIPTLSNIEYDSKTYSHEAKRKAMNYNPILTGNLFLDKCKIIILLFEYKVYALLKILFGKKKLL